MSKSIKSIVIDTIRTDDNVKHLAFNLLTGPGVCAVAYKLSKKYPNSKLWQPRMSWKAIWTLEAVASALYIAGFVMSEIEDMDEHEKEAQRIKEWAENRAPQGPFPTRPSFTLITDEDAKEA